MSHEGDSPQAVAAQTVYNDGVLRVTALSSPPGLAIAGEIDEDTYPALVEKLAEFAGCPEVHLDLAGVTYCDLAGLRVIIRLANASRGRRLVLHEIPHRLRTVLAILGWDSTPGLVIDRIPARADVRGVRVMAMANIVVRPMHEAEVEAADQVMRVAFGTFLGMPDPASFGGDASLVRSRFIADPSAAFTAEVEGSLAGSSFATNWGSAGFFGPLTVRPDLWNRGVGRRLMEPVMERFDHWGTRHAGLFTFANSAKHIGLYQRFGFWPRFLTVILDAPVAPAGPPSPAMLFSSVAGEDRGPLLARLRELTGSLYDGLDLTHEIEQASSQRIGETIIIDDDRGVAGFAVCQFGPGSEGGTGTCYAKFGGVRPGANAAAAFGRLLGACEAFARDAGLQRVVAGVNTARTGAYGALLARGYRPGMYGVAMHRPNDPGYSRPDVFVIDDWR